MTTGEKTVPGPGTPLHAWGIEVGGTVHGLLFVCELHAGGCAATSAAIAATGAHEGRRLVRLPQLDVAPELVANSICFICREPSAPSPSTPARPRSTKEN